MFDHRLKVMLLIFGAAAAVIVGRLVDLQVVRGAYYARRAERALTLRPRVLPCVRGSIVDRRGAVLVRDEPSWDVAIDYAVLAADVDGDPVAIRRVMRRWNRRFAAATDDDEMERLFRVEIAAMWSRLASEFSTPNDPIEAEDLRTRAWEVCQRVRRIRAVVADRRGFDGPVAEERRAHPVVVGLDADRQVAARGLFRHYPWLHIQPSSTRTFVGDATPFAHVLGRLGRVDARTVADDPNASDPFAKYLADEHAGVSGVEYVGEQRLRGRRGQITKDRNGEIIDLIEPLNGQDVSLTIDAELQRRLYTLLGETVGAVREASGGAIVVLDVETREVLALVSYPSYDPSRFREFYATLRDDTDRMPLRFRAVASRYAPGSTIKPLVCLAGLMKNAITLDTTEHCTGYLFEEHRDRWRCWKIHGSAQRMAHGDVNVVQTLTGSCNIFMYRLGERLGVDALCDVFDMVGIGRTSGTRLREEASGINPTPGWLLGRKNRPVNRAHARLFAIGAGELTMTPVQVANLIATYANGRYRPVTLVRDGQTTPQWTLPATPEQLDAIWHGIYGVVNDPNGTAHKHAYFVHERYALCGKTGSATATPWATSYEIPYLDENGIPSVVILPGGTRRTVLARFSRDHPAATVDPDDVRVTGTWPPNPPPPGDHYAHAWFGGYLQEIDANRNPDWSKTPRVAFAVLVEFGGSGGRTTGPLARRVAGTLLDVLGPELTAADPRSDVVDR